MLTLSGPAFVLGVFMVYREMGKFSPELNLTEYFDSLLYKWVGPAVIMLVLGLLLTVVAFIAWYIGRQKRPTAS